MADEAATGCFEPLHARARARDTVVPWAREQPHPLLVTWTTERRELDGTGRVMRTSAWLRQTTRLTSGRPADDERAIGTRRHARVSSDSGVSPPPLRSPCRLRTRSRTATIETHAG